MKDESIRDRNVYCLAILWLMIMNNLINWTLKLHNWVVAQYSAGSTIDTLLMPCILTLHIRAGPSDGLWVSWSHHERSGEERSEGGAPSVGERSSEMVTNATNCRDCQPLMDLQRWETSDSFVITDGPRWAVLWKFYLNHDNYNELLTHQVSAGGSWQIGISSNLFMHSPGLT